jgi:hypothetical protein
MAEGDVKLGTSYVEIVARIEKLEAGLKSAESRTDTAVKKMQTSFGGLTTTLSRIGGMIGIAFGTQQLIQFGKEALNLAAKGEAIRTAFKRIGSEDLLGDLRKSVSGTVSDINLMTNAVRASNFKIPLDQLATLFEFAKRRADETGQSVDYLVDSIIMGIGRKSPMILDNLGISAIALREKLGKVGTEAASIGDITKAVGDIAKEELLKMGNAADTSANKIARMNATIENLKEQIGTGLTDTVTDFTDQMDKLARVGKGEGLSNIIDFWLKMVSIVPRKVTLPALDFIGGLFSGTSPQIPAMNTYGKRPDPLLTYKQAIQPSGKTIGEIEQQIQDLQEAQKGLIAGSPKWIENLRQIKELSDSITYDFEEIEKAAKKAALLDAQDKRLTMPFDEQIKGWQKAREERQKYFDEFAKNNIDLMGGRTFTGAMNHIAMPGLPAFDFGSQSQIMEDWIAQSEVTQAAYNTLFDSLMTGFDMVRIKAATAANDTTKFWINMANSMIAEIERILVKWALLNLFGLIGGTGGVNLFSMVAGKASGGPVMANTPYVVGEKGPELFVSNSAGTIIPNNVVNNMMNSKGIEQRLDVLNANLIQQSVNRRYDKLQIEGQTDIANETIRVSYQRADKIYKRLS